MKADVPWGGVGESRASLPGTNRDPKAHVGGLLHRMGFRYRMYQHGIPGNADIVFPRQKKAIFVQNCFLFQHPESLCARVRTPHPKNRYWVSKLGRNVEERIKNQATLAALGWAVLVVWECETDDDGALSEKLAGFLAPG